MRRAVESFSVTVDDRHPTLSNVSLPLAASPFGALCASSGALSLFVHRYATMAETSCSRSFWCCAITSSGFWVSGWGTVLASTAPGQKFGIRVAGLQPLGYSIQVRSHPWVVLLAMLVSVGPRFASSL